MRRISTPLIIIEFFKALGKTHTYNILKNGYVVFGLLWGVPVPIVTVGLSLYCRGLAVTPGNILNELYANPLHVFFLLHPFIFAVVFGAMGTVRDDQEKRKLEFEKDLISTNDELEHMNARLMELDELKDNFLSMVSHELKTPLTTIQGYVSFLKDTGPDPLSDKQKKMLEIVAREGDHLNHLINDLVELSKIHSGKFRINPTPANLAKTAERAINSLRRAFDAKKIIIENDLAGDMPLALADEERIYQVFINLLGNALKFTEPGGKVRVEGREKNGKIIFSVSDTGIGIPADKISSVFDRFYQADSSTSRKYGGCGLGLAIAKNIIDRHEGGRMWAESRHGQGSKFSFEINALTGHEKEH